MKRCPDSALFTFLTSGPETGSDERERPRPNSARIEDELSQPNEGDIDVMAKRKRTDPYLLPGAWDISLRELGKDSRGRRIGVGGKSKSVKRPTWFEGRGHLNRAKNARDRHNKSGRGTQAVLRKVKTKKKEGTRLYYQKRQDTKLTKKVKASRKRSAAAKKGWEKRRGRK